MTELRAFRGSIIHCLEHPVNGAGAAEVFEDGMLLVDRGRIGRTGPAEQLLPALGGDVEIVDLRGKLILPGFVDSHVHYPQMDIVASYGEQLLDWLNRYAFPAELEFADPRHATGMANRFVDALLANGTTSALVFATVHAHSASALFEAADRRNMRLITGKTLMDSSAPDALLDTPQSAESESRALIEQWHGRGRLGYAITPRFALTSSDEQLSRLGRLAAEFPDVHIHTHLAENREEVAQVAARFPESRSYLDVYRQFGLLRERTVFAHCIHLDDDDRQSIADARAGIAFCPSSNLFLGSGLFGLDDAEAAGIDIGLGTDVGAGPSLSPLKTLADAYRVGQLRHLPLDPLHGLYLATLGAARALRLDSAIGNFLTGKEADFTVLDTDLNTPVADRCRRENGLEDRLFALQLLGDERNVHSTWLMGEPAYRRDPALAN